MNRLRKLPVHTTVTEDALNKLKNKYGSGSLNDGKENVIKIAETKQFDVKEELLRITNRVLSEYKEYEDPFHRYVDIGIKSCIWNIQSLYGEIEYPGKIFDTCFTL